jgi:DNA anti-recombination protein RmuC
LAPEYGKIATDELKDQIHEETFKEILGQLRNQKSKLEEELAKAHNKESQIKAKIESLRGTNQELRIKIREEMNTKYSELDLQ